MVGYVEPFTYTLLSTLFLGAQEYFDKYGANMTHLGKIGTSQT